MPSDGELVRQALDGRMAAYEELARRWSARVLAFCHARTGCAHVAEDLAQETLLRGLRGLATLQSPDKFGPWLRGIAHRAYLDWRKSKQTSQVPFSVLGTDGLPANDMSTARDATAEQVERRDQLRHLMAEVEALPDDCREVVMLYYYHEVTYRDLAELLGVSSATINARLTKARALLRKRLGSPLNESC